MSIEQVIENLVKSIDRLTDVIELSNASKHSSAPAVVADPAPSTASSPSLFDNSSAAVPVRHVEVPQQPVITPAPAPVAQVVTMPAPPAFITPAPAPVAAGALFNDPKGLIEYVVSSYKAMGPEKGAKIQGVLASLGYQNINDVKPEHYAALYAGVEGLK